MEGGSRVPRLVAALVVVAIAVAGCGKSVDSTMAEPVRTGDPVRTFAPLVHLHPQEKWFPIRTERFLAHSTLEWSSPCFGEINVAAGPVSQKVTGEGAPRLDPRRLGHEPAYRVRARSADCKTRTRRVYSTRDHTRPFDVGRAPGLPLEQGFSLDFLLQAYEGEKRVERRDGQAELVGLPAYFQREPIRIDGRPGLRITYWLLFGVSETLDRKGEDVASHEGDWERVSVVVEQLAGIRYRPLSMAFYREGSASTAPWTDVKTAGTHPEVFLARRDHSPYAEAREHRRRVRTGDETKATIDETAACAACPEWRTWEQLRDVGREPWFGYRGGWGVDGQSSESSGPLGPAP